MGSTPNLDTTSAKVFRKMCAKFRFSISSRCDDIVAEVKGGNFMPPAAGVWRGGPAAAGLTTVTASGVEFQRQAPILAKTGSEMHSRVLIEKNNSN